MSLDGSLSKFSQHTCEISSQIPRRFTVVVGQEGHTLSASTGGAGSQGGCCGCGKEKAHTFTQLELRGLHLVIVRPKQVS